MGELDVVQIPGYPKMWARRCMVEGWIKAGRPPIDWAGRTYEQQKYLSDGWKAHRPGFNPADDPDLSWTRVPHVRGMAFDLAVYNAETVDRMEAAGFIRPITVTRGEPWPDGRGGFSGNEPWHFELARYFSTIRDIPKVTNAQVASLGSTPFTPAEQPEKDEDDDMPKNTGVYTQRAADKHWIYLVFNYGSGIGHEFGSGSTTAMPGAYNNALAAAFDTPAWAKVTEAHYAVIKSSLEKVLKIDIPDAVDVSVDGPVDIE